MKIICRRSLTSSDRTNWATRVWYLSGFDAHRMPVWVSVRDSAIPLDSAIMMLEGFASTEESVLAYVTGTYAYDCDSLVPVSESEINVEYLVFEVAGAIEIEARAMRATSHWTPAAGAGPEMDGKCWRLALMALGATPAERVCPAMEGARTALLAVAQRSHIAPGAIATLMPKFVAEAEAQLGRKI